MKVSINEPCHENWEAMTPNQQGAFCKSCMKDVVDFSKKSINEIKDFFSKPQGKVCGRFEEKQLQELSFDDFFSRFTYWNFSRKFVVIFFMAFGFWIFSDSAAKAQQDNFMKGEVAYVPEKKEDPKKPVAAVLGQPIVHKAEPVVMGKIKCVDPKTVKQNKKEEPRKPVVQTKTIKGKINVQAVTNTPVQDKEPAKPERDAIKMGLIAYTPEEEKRPGKVLHVIPVSTADEKRPVKPVSVTPVVNPELDVPLKQVENALESSHDRIVILYPNPNNGIFTIDANDKKVLAMFDMTGKMVHTQNVDGRSKVNASHLPDGSYTLTLTGSGKTTHSKIIITH